MATPITVAIAIALVVATVALPRPIALATLMAPPRDALRVARRMSEVASPNAPRCPNPAN
eukprot:6437564-Pyramimonas_sp.AAC.1